MKMKTCNRKPAIIRAMLVMTMVLALTGALTACRAADKAESAIESGLDGGTANDGTAGNSLRRRLLRVP